VASPRIPAPIITISFVVDIIEPPLCYGVHAICIHIVEICSIVSESKQNFYIALRKCAWV